MFGLGVWEICLIFIVVIIFVRPNDLPSFVRKMGRLYQQALEAYHLVLANLRETDNRVKGMVKDTIHWEKNLADKAGKKKLKKTVGIKKKKQMPNSRDTIEKESLSTSSKATLVSNSIEKHSKDEKKQSK